MKNLKLFVSAALASLLCGCQVSNPLETFAQGMTDTSVKNLNEVVFKMQYCQILPDRTAKCQLEATSKYRDRNINLAGYIRLQDNNGVEYVAAQRGFGDPAGKLSRYQTAVADQPYRVTAIITNLSTQATSIRAVVFDRIDLTFVPTGFIGSHKQIIFSKPTMLGVNQGPTSTVDTQEPLPSSAPSPAPSSVSAPPPTPAVVHTAPTPAAPTPAAEVNSARPQSSFEVGFNRPFSDIGMLTLEKPEPTLCQAQCVQNGRCKSWTYVKPGIQAATAVCWLKNGVPGPVPDVNTTSGVITGR